MKLAIMQPYFFPYLGYFQLIHAVDQFVIYDDVNYINKGWISRNKILVGHSTQYITLALKKRSQNKKINELELFYEEDAPNKNLRAIYNAYQKAPYFKQVYPLLENIFADQEKNLSLFLTKSIIKVSDYLGISTPFIMSSAIEKDNSLIGEEKILCICNKLGADKYINAYGGKNLYTYNNFKENDIELYFLKTKNIEYTQFDKNHVCDLSIIDIMMFNSVNEIGKMLNQYDLENQ